MQAIDSPEADVQIWMAELDSISPEKLGQLLTSLDLSERERAARFHFERDRRRFTAARGLLRALLGKALNVSAAAVAFKYGPHGKPDVATAARDERILRFNLSHAGGMAIFALTLNRNIGIDIESAERFARNDRELSNLAARILSPREFEVWRILPNESTRSEALLRAWTRKEAYLKATGAGFSEQLQEIEVALDAAAPGRSMKIADRWAVTDLPSDRGFAAALAVEMA